MIRPDGLEVAVDTIDGIVVWDLDPAHWVAAVCQSVGRNLTRAEWDEYVGESRGLPKHLSGVPARLRCGADLALSTNECQRTARRR